MLSHTKTFATLAFLLSASDVVSAQVTVTDTAVVPIQTYVCGDGASLSDCSSAGNQLTSLQLAGCNVAACISAAAGTTAACAAAGLEEFLNPIADLACFGSFTGTIAGCEGCF